MDVISDHPPQRDAPCLKTHTHFYYYVIIEGRQSVVVVLFLLLLFVVVVVFDSTYEINRLKINDIIVTIILLLLFLLLLFLLLLLYNWKLIQCVILFALLFLVLLLEAVVRYVLTSNSNFYHYVLNINFYYLNRLVSLRHSSVGISLPYLLQAWAYNLTTKLKT